MWVATHWVAIWSQAIMSPSAVNNGEYIKKALKMIAESEDGIFRAAVRVQNSDIVRWLPQSLVINEAARMRRSGKRSSVDG
jgi:hypothetical protein